MTECLCKANYTQVQTYWTEEKKRKKKISVQWWFRNYALLEQMSHCVFEYCVSESANKCNNIKNKKTYLLIKKKNRNQN